MKLPHDLVHAPVPTPLGPMRLAATPRGLAGCWFDGQRHGPDLADRPQNEAHPLLREAARQITDYLSGRREQFDLPLDMGAGTAFQQTVWNALLTIPRGRTTRYGDLAIRIGRPRAVRAVGAAVGRNPLGIIVPCHRVLGASGDLTGYAAGLPRKQALLRLEGALA